MTEDGQRLDKARPKLVETKERWAAEGRRPNPGRPASDRLPPGQRRVTEWPVLDLGIQPDVPLDQWQLHVHGAVEAPFTWTWADFEAEPVFRDTSDIHCVTSWSRYENAWEGVSARRIVELCRPKPEAKFVLFESYDGYTTNVPLPAFDDDDVLLASRWEGKPISREHGGPVRVVLPKLYFWKSAKWVRQIVFAKDDQPGFWEVRGYHMNGDPWREERYGTP